MKESIVDSQMWIRLDLDISLKANILYQVDSKNRAHFLTLLLLYEKIYIPTKDFGIVPLLINWLGLRNFISLLKTDSLGFIFIPSLIGYGGGGLGLSLFEIVDTREKPFAWHQATTFSTSDKSIDLQILNQCPFISLTERSKLCRRILEKTVNLELNKEFFQKNIRDETYNDILENDYLTTIFPIDKSASNKKQTLNSLPNISNNQYRILGMTPATDPIDYLLRIAEINLELIFGQATSDSDIGTSLGSEKLLINKLKRNNVNQEALNGFLQLMELNNIPDITAVIISGNLSINDFFRIRNSRNARIFRKWLRKCDISEAHELEKLFVGVLRNKSLINSLPLRALRFFITAGIGLLTPPILSLPISAANSFLIEKLASGYNPSLFINDLSKIKIEKEDK